MTEFEHACPRCGDTYETYREVKLCEEAHVYCTSALLDEHFQAMKKEVFICVYMLKQNVVPWTQRWSKRMPSENERSRYRSN